MKKLLSVVMIMLFTITTFAQKEFQMTYTEAHLKKADSELITASIQTTITFNYENQKVVRIDIGEKSYLYKITGYATTEMSEEFGEYQSVTLDNNGKQFLLFIFNNQKYGTLLSDGTTMFWFK